MRVLVGLLAGLLLLGGSGCAVVKVKERAFGDIAAERNVDALSGGRLSIASSTALNSAGLDPAACARDPDPCIAQLRPLSSAEEWLATSAELQLLRMNALPATVERSAEAGAFKRSRQAAAEIAQVPADVAAADPRTRAAVATARYAYAYLFATARTPEQRVFEARQQQVLQYYNRAVEAIAQAAFAASAGKAEAATLDVGGLELGAVLHGYDPADIRQDPQALLASDTLGFANLRAVYRRDGFGTALVAVFPPRHGADAASASAESAAADSESAASANAAAANAAPPAASYTFANAPRRRPIAAARNDAPYRDTRYLPVTVTLRFDGEGLDGVLASRRAQLDVYNPYRIDSETIAGRKVPLAANYSAAYGIWLARSELARLSLSSLLRPKQARAFKPRVYLNQPYDPDKRVIVLIHGLASSPEAWVNLANELLGDESLRRRYQLWQVFYPTNIDMLSNRAAIASALQQTFRHYDPQGDDVASHDAVLVGHSMGGVIGRLLLSDSGGHVADAMLEGLDPALIARVRKDPLLRELTVFQPMPQFGRAVFMASPQRGAVVTDGWPLRMVRKLIRLPLDVLRETAELIQRYDVSESDLERIGLRKGKPPTGPDDLSPNSRFMHATRDLSIEPGLPYHVIVAQRDPKLPLAQSDDGVVPYPSAHMDGAVSEKAIASGHSVQETPQAIAELRRILHEDVATFESRGKR
ncbi:esterase/lipase family protein [Lysobacter enzymogenes]|uniref:esterase/lipase family protein n=1 Tax=Lysobacter enzymogenes TaxID=69 RepID=UPI00099C5587|nr:alpha/beta hydrolase [Lysobacter enzymogenes]UZW59914.1 alpha/beta hydrolase [Lysobacter enzymogenes]